MRDTEIPYLSAFSPESADAAKHALAITQQINAALAQSAVMLRFNRRPDALQTLEVAAQAAKRLHAAVLAVISTELLVIQRREAEVRARHAEAVRRQQALVEDAAREGRLICGQDGDR